MVTTKQEITNEGGELEIVSVKYRLGKAKLNVDCTVPLAEGDLECDCVLVPKNTTCWIVQFLDDGNFRIDLEVELGNGVKFYLKNRYVLSTYLKEVQNWDLLPPLA